MTGEGAPLRRDLQEWMLEHPGYMAEVPDLLGSSSSSSQGALTGLSASSSNGETRRGRKPKHDTDTIDITTLTGSENVTVIHRESGKKVIHYCILLTLSNCSMYLSTFKY